MSIIWEESWGRWSVDLPTHPITIISTGRGQWRGLLRFHFITIDVDIKHIASNGMFLFGPTRWEVFTMVLDFFKVDGRFGRGDCGGLFG